jgi:ABC-type phosphate/phosphonate transport system substrate-binding protein
LIVTKGTRNCQQTGTALRLFRLGLLALVLGANASALAHKPTAKAVDPAASRPRITLAINEGGAANADFSETQLRYQDFVDLIAKTLRMQVVMVGVRDRNKLKNSLKKQEYELLVARPNDVPALAIRDFGYQLIATAKDSYQTLFIVPKDSPLRTIADVKGKSIVTPDAYSNMWRVANAMLRDNKIDMSREQVRAMRDQAAIGWSMENGFFDVGVVNSTSGVGRGWEKKGGRVIARSRDLPNMPFIASPAISPAQVAQLRALAVSLESSDEGREILKKIGLTAFQETPPKVMLDFLAWLGEEAKDGELAAKTQ